VPNRFALVLAVVFVATGCGSSHHPPTSEKPTEEASGKRVTAGHSIIGLDQVASACADAERELGTIHRHTIGQDNPGGFKYSLLKLVNESLPVTDAALYKLRHIKVAPRLTAHVSEFITNLVRDQRNLGMIKRTIARVHGSSYGDFPEGTIARLFTVASACVRARTPISG
jgi:hypothetical protein